MTNPCVVCGGTVSREFLDNVCDYEYGVDWQGQLKGCQDCGLVQQSPMLTAQEAISLYPKNYVHYNPQVTGLRSQLMKFYMKRNVRSFRSLGATAGQRLLDIGCGGGEKASFLRDTLKLKVVGIEPSNEAAERARELYRLDVINGTFPHTDLASEPFDFVHINHVIEHVPDPVDFLKDIHNHLKDGGWVVGETENIDCLSFQIFKRYWSFLHVPFHLLFFTPQTLVNIFERAGFKNVQIGFSSDPTAWSLSTQNWLRRSQPQGAASAARMPGYLFVTALSVPISWLESKQGPVMRFCARKG